MLIIQHKAKATKVSYEKGLLMGSHSSKSHRNSRKTGLSSKIKMLLVFSD